VNAKLLLAACAVLIAVVSGLQWEIKSLQAEQERARLREGALLAAIEKFERDLLAKQRVDEKQWLAALAEQDAARRKQIDDALKALPMGSFRQPVYWDDKQPQEKGKN
jgi:hypothetical protein